ncbi:DUF309 domain-containing protein [Halegenticoccus tardaugens]|uniref:DUF309 domain-containing protein n=1 Tax=Halegenticoccus tardaugens TaxID=2071624 RepID=UPI00100B52D7|nr:DUF309 domain-containing protein [Halegenticoccus tardaugens]
MDDALRAGVAIYNAGEHHAAHDAWEDRWLELERGTDDERFLHGLIQFTAAIHHARRRNWRGATGLAASAGEYLGGLPPTYRGVDLAPIRGYLAALARDPEIAERRRPPALTVDGHALRPSDLDFEAAAVAARVLAEDDDRFDGDVLARAIEFAREELEEGTRTRFIALVADFAAKAERRELVYRRLREHVERRTQREEDVDGLFD